ncbi:hypothetical protein A8H29_28870 [Burkholderia cenocepacia]|nr:hypothetical protein A8H29_28870 [Burkholderia cenocepacia]
MDTILPSASAKLKTGWLAAYTRTPYSMAGFSVRHRRDQHSLVDRTIDVVATLLISKRHYHSRIRDI